MEDDLQAYCTLTLECALRDIYTVEEDESSLSKVCGVIDTRDVKDDVLSTVRAIPGEGAADRVDWCGLSLWLLSDAYIQYTLLS